MKKYGKYIGVVAVCLFLLVMCNRKKEEQSVLETQDVVENQTSIQDTAITEFDKITNQNINALKCTKEEFLKRQEFTTGYTDISKTSFDKKTITFKAGYAETKYYAYKNFAKSVVKTFRDFPCIDKIKLVIVPTQTSDFRKNLVCQITREQAATFFNLNFDEIRADIRVFRSQYLENPRFDKDFFMSFGDKFVH